MSEVKEFEELADQVSDKDIFDSVKIDDADTTEEKKTKAKKDKPTPKEVEKMSDKEVMNLESEVNELYDEFSTFLEDKTDIITKAGTKELITSGIDLLDAILGGGFPIGALSILVGAPGSGKSMLAAQTLGNAQKKYKGKAITAYLDSEIATTSVRLANLGVRYPKIKPYGEVTIEKVFKFLEGLCLFKEKKGITDPSIVIWDSIANTITQKAIEADDINSVIGLKARMLSILLPKYIAKMSQYNICLIAVNQLRDMLNIGNFSAPKDLKFMSGTKDMPGGQSLKFNAFHLAQMKIKSVLDSNKFGFDGIMVSTKLVKNKLFPPNIVIDLVGDFRTGFSNFWTNYNFLVTTGRLKSGAWNYLVPTPQVKFRTKDSKSMYDTDPKFKEAFDEATREAIQTEIIEKNTIIEQ